MAKVKVGIPQGTRDFGPDVVRKRNYIFNTIRNVFELYGFQPLETPAMENLDTLLGKYGDEGDKLIFKILNNGLNDPSNIDKAKAAFENVLKGKNDRDLTERALKYDLTIPFARYVAMNHNQLSFPFKRYQIQPVWRADRPQKGRYREFYQCDADVVGSNSLLNELELALIYHQVFNQLGIKHYELRINHRKILTALAELCGGAERMNDIAVSIDKLDKIGLEKVKDELKTKGLNEKQLGVIEKYLGIGGNNAEKINAVNDLIGANESGKKGIGEIKYLINAEPGPLNSPLIIDFTLARGLNYYTGTIFEAKAPPEIKIGSIGGGGRYDDLTGLFGVPNIPGVGISFGVDRIYDVMEELNLFPAEVHVGIQVLFFNLGENESKAAFSLMQQLRGKNTRCELYHENVKFDKQFKYAEKKNIPYAIIIGSKELEEKSCTIKNLLQGSQQTISHQELLNYDF
ncbi:MAG TPA: histidine--tRNA ligase [Chitinophagaceae bacterium]|nr:histidine--tRNA ligase [Chitinophagaceae bacterium]